MLNILLIIAFITSVYAYAYKQLPYNVNIKNVKKMKKNEINEINMNDLPDYTIPKWVYLNVFKYNKKTKLQDKNFYHQIK